MIKLWLAAIFSTLAAVETVRSQLISAKFAFLGGSSISNNLSARYPANYGISSTEIAPYNPGSRYSHAIVEYNGMIYSFFGVAPVISLANDVWMWNPVSKTWTWISGKSNSGNPTYGGIGVASNSNTPGIRYYFCGEVHRARNEYILFGGNNRDGNHGDLWTFGLISNAWTWLQGLSTALETPNHGSLGVSTASTSPGARTSPACAVHDPSAEFLLFGGTSYDFMGDMWSYSFTFARWTWISGTSSTTESAVVGPKGLWATSHRPSRRAYCGAAMDTRTSVFYIFGGYLSPYFLNDLWAFKKDTLEWTWLSGTTMNNALASFGNFGHMGIANIPEARSSFPMVYHAQLKLLLLHGGITYDAVDGISYAADFWAYNISSNEWAWIAGSSLKRASANFESGKEQLPSLTEHGMTIDQVSGGIYIFGGSVLDVTVDHVWSASIAILSLSSIQPSPTSSSQTQSSRFSSAPNPTSLSSSLQFRISSPIYSSADQISSTIIFSSKRSPVSLSQSSRFSSVYIQSQARIVGFTTGSELYVSTSKFSPSMSVIRNLPPQHSSSYIADIPDRTIIGILKSLYANKIVGISAAALLLVFIFVSVFYICAAKRLAGKISSSSTDTMTISETVTGESADTTAVEPTTSSSLPSTAVDSSTVAVGLYLPGGLELDSPNAFRVEKEIARGGHGSVWIATAFDSRLCVYGSKVIVKIPHRAINNERDLELFHQEIALVNAFKKHPNIVKLLGYSERPHAIILKCYALGSLSMWIGSKSRPLAQGHAFIKDISHGLLALNDHGVAHCDIKPDNILLDSGRRLTAVLTDFGIARVVTDQLLTVAAYQIPGVINGASLAYAAPEVLTEFRKGIKGTRAPRIIMSRDVYAFALVILGILDGRDPWTLG